MNAALRLTSAFATFITLLGFSLCAPGTATAQESMRATLYVVDANGATILDGNLTDYGTNYCNCIDWDDAGKMANPGENFGIIRDGVSLVIERRQVFSANDSTTFSFWNLQQSRNYQLVISTENFTQPNLIAYLRDNYLGNVIPLSMNNNTAINFNISSDPASGNAQRFQLIFETVTNPVPVTFAGIKAIIIGSLSQVKWTVENEISIEKYIVEQSADGRFFRPLATVAASSKITADYTVNDNSRLTGKIFYRVKAQGLDGKFQYSDVVSLQVNKPTATAAFSVYPNPVVGGQLGLELINASIGMYSVQLYTATGIMINLGDVEVNNISGRQIVALKDRVPAGNYLVLLSGKNGSHMSAMVQVK